MNGIRHVNDLHAWYKILIISIGIILIVRKCKNGQDKSKPDPGPIFSGKKSLPKNSLSHVGCKNEVFEKPDFGRKIRIWNVRESI